MTETQISPQPQWTINYIRRRWRFFPQIRCIFSCWASVCMRVSHALCIELMCTVYLPFFPAVALSQFHFLSLRAESHFSVISIQNKHSRVSVVFFSSFLFHSISFLARFLCRVVILRLLYMTKLMTRSNLFYCTRTIRLECVRYSFLLFSVLSS